MNDLFISVFLSGFSFNDEVWLFYYSITILIILGIYFKINKRHLVSKRVFNISLILGLLGTLYAITLILKAIGSPAIPSDDVPYYLFNGLASAIQPLVLAFFGWQIVSVMDIFISREKQ
jgi:hypothetical protein